ncbi:Hypothetical predicted protein [Olea europaea subsp. europaea]|uniref:Uncharacterized protein n=1 Tax=Olea europaea subsp. europaea TaxID=158383 RepID=A0A8S0P8F4_OLEEU|nr:Hypothetical predicted protein [Olea europaea subsp. europaea]
MIKKIKSMDVIEPWKLDIGRRSYRYEELKKATGGFKDGALIGYLGFGIVYKGTLPNTNTKVAGDDLLLVYDFMSNGSLDKYIFDEPKLTLTWERMFKIIKSGFWTALFARKMGTTCDSPGYQSRQCAVGFKVKWQAMRLRTCQTIKTRNKSNQALGYLAPELTKTGKPTTSFDVLLLEIVCAREPIEVLVCP